MNTLTDVYIGTAWPVSSDMLFKTGFFDISCPTIRNEMANLTEQGYLAQPHTSAGRIPTQRGYRFFVDDLMKSIGEVEPSRVSAHNKHEKSVQSVAEEVAQQISDLVVFADRGGKIEYRGLKKVLGNPEFASRDTILSLIEELEHFEHRVARVMTNMEEEITVFIGNENPFFERDEYSVITSRFDNQLMVLVGPMRMNYRRNLEVLARYFFE